MFRDRTKYKYVKGGCYSEFENGNRVYDKEVANIAKKQFSLFDRIFNLNKVTTNIINIHAELCEKAGKIK